MIIEWSSGCARATNDTRDFALNQKPVLLLHCDGADASQTFKDSGGTGHTVTAVGTAQVDTEQSKFGGASLLLDGNSDWLTIPDHANWDVVGSAIDNQTISLWVKHSDHAGSEYYITHMENYPGDMWCFRHNHGTGLHFWATTGGSTIIEVIGGGEITDTNWHFIAMCKVADKYGIYLDGTQVAYTADSSTDIYAGTLYIGEDGSVTASCFYGWLDEICIVPANIFNAAPNAGLTDTIMVPSRPYISWR